VFKLFVQLGKEVVALSELALATTDLANFQITIKKDGQNLEPSIHP